MSAGSSDVSFDSITSTSSQAARVGSVTWVEPLTSASARGGSGLAARVRFGSGLGSFKNRAHLLKNGLNVNSLCNRVDLMESDPLQSRAPPRDLDEEVAAQR